MMRLTLLLTLACLLGSLESQDFAPGAEIEVDLSGAGRWARASVVRVDGDSVVFRLNGVATLRKTSRSNVRLAGSAPSAKEEEAEDPRSPCFGEWRLFQPVAVGAEGGDPDGVDFVEPAGTLLVGPDGAYTWVLPAILGPGEVTQGQWYSARPEEMGGRTGIGLILDEASGGAVWLLLLDPPRQDRPGSRVRLESQEEAKNVLVGVRPADVPARPQPEEGDAEAATGESESESEAAETGAREEDRDPPPLLLGVWSLGDPALGQDDRSAGELSLEPNGSFLWAKNVQDMETWLSGSWRPAEEADLGGVPGTGIVLIKFEGEQDFLLLAQPENDSMRLIDRSTGDTRFHGLRRE